jgi:PAS domain S-box-containing protein
MENKEDLFHSIFENSGAAMAIFNLDTTIAAVNDAYCKLSGYTKEEAIGMKWTQQITPEDVARLTEYNQSRLLNSDGAPNEYEFSFYTKQGERKQAYAFVKLITEHNLIIISFVDTTDRNKAEILIAKQQEELKQLLNKQDNELARQSIQLIKNTEQKKLLTIKLQKLRHQLKPENIPLFYEIDKFLEEMSGWQQPETIVKLNDHLENLNPAFITNLRNKHSDLTPGEIKLCSLLHLNLGTKEIAAITSQTYDSVRVARTRLRKKLKLETDSNLITYLMQF